MKNLLFIFTFFIFQVAYSQNQGNKWYFGYMSALDFNSGSPPASISGCQIIPLPQDGTWFPSNEGTSTISDNLGNLLFYSEGQHVWNRANQVMPHGDSLLGCYSSTTSSFIIPVPLSNRFFYLFTTDGLENNLANGLRYSKIDMCLDSGRGDVITKEKNILLLDTVSEKLTGVNHPNGRDIWLIAHKHFSDAFYAYLITPNGITDTVITHIGSIYGPSVWQAQGQMKASPDGKKIASLISNNGVPNGAILDFNDSTGVLSNLINLTSISDSYSLDWSPDNSKLYTWGFFSGFNQFDLSGGTEAAINSSMTAVTSGGCIPCGIQLGPDGKIYTANGDAILYPNLPAASCGFTTGYLSIGAGSDFPSFISSFNYHNKQCDCSGEFIGEEIDNPQLKVYPSPAKDNLTIENKQQAIIEISSIEGQILKRFKINYNKTDLDISDLTKGVYIIRAQTEKGVTTKKFIKE